MSSLRFNWKNLGGASLGAAFLMANSSIGPGFLVQTTVYTQQLMTSFGFVILVSVLIDIGAQLNTWRILTVSESRAQDLSNQLLPGLGYALSVLVVLGGFAFNIGNISGCGLGLNVLTGMSFSQGAILSGAAALLLFWLREIGKMLDGFTKIIGVIKISLTLFIAWKANPPLAQAAYHTILPEKFSMLAIVTIVGGTVGGYLTFSGAHRLLDAGIKGRSQMARVDRSAISGIFISTLMRTILFLAIVGALTAGAIVDKENGPASIFRFVAGNAGYKIFGVVLWGAALSSVIGASYTSVSFFKTFSPVFIKYERVCISVFIVLATAVFVLVGKPRELLLFAGAVNGMILPLALGVMLIAARNKKLMKGYVHPRWMQAAGWMVVAIMGVMAVLSFVF